VSAAPGKPPLSKTALSRPALTREDLRVRLLIVDDEQTIRKLCVTVGEALGFICLEADSGESALTLLEEQPVHMILSDMVMPHMSGLEFLERAKKLLPRIEVALMTGHGSIETAVQAMKLGCSGIVLKQTAPELIVKSIRKVHGGEIWLDSHTTAAVMRQFAAPGEISGGGSGKTRERSPLSQREREIVQLVAQGYKNKEMAEKMFISEQTVKNHLHNIFDKLGVSDRLELALYAIHKGLHLTAER